MKSFINYEVLTKDIKKNHWVHFKSGDIVLCLDIFLHFVVTLMLHIKPPENYLDRIQVFLPYNIELRNKEKYELYVIESMNETPLYLDMFSSTTVQTIGSKKVNIRTEGQENWK